MFGVQAALPEKSFSELLLCVLCASVVNKCLVKYNHRGTEDTEKSINPNFSGKASSTFSLSVKRSLKAELKTSQGWRLTASLLLLANAIEDCFVVKTFGVLLDRYDEEFKLAHPLVLEVAHALIEKHV